MTKVEAIAKVMEDNGGAASLSVIYDNITKYYPTAKDPAKWQEGIRGVLYRAIREKNLFKNIGLSIYAIADYQEEEKPQAKDKIRMHSYIEGLCLELGNFENYLTYTADPSMNYRDNLKLGDIATMHELPQFSYDKITNEARRIDVIWFNEKGLAFPKKVYEVVDSIGTLNGAFNRSLQLQHFITDFCVVAPEKHRAKFEQTIDLEIYQNQKERFTFMNYDEIQDWYETSAKKNRIEGKIFG